MHLPARCVLLVAHGAVTNNHKFMCVRLLQCFRLAAPWPTKTEHQAAVQSIVMQGFASRTVYCHELRTSESLLGRCYGTVPYANGTEQIRYKASANICTQPTESMTLVRGECNGFTRNDTSFIKWQNFIIQKQNDLLRTKKLPLNRITAHQSPHISLEV